MNWYKKFYDNKNAFKLLDNDIQLLLKKIKILFMSNIKKIRFLKRKLFINLMEMS